MDALATEKKLNTSDMATLCRILGIVFPIVANILMQDRINLICTAKDAVQEVAPATAGEINVDDLKKLKELLDMGAITQAEYDAKKKQLLGLPDMDPAPAAPQNIGKCVACGRENVPVETIEVVVAGMSRKRSLCAECAARYR